MDNETTPTAEELAQKQEAEAKAKAEEAKKKALEEDPEIAAKAEKKANLDKAIEEAENTLREKRKLAKDAGKPEEKPGEEVIPTIDDNDPGAKAWNKRIKDTVDPLARDLEKEKSEVRQFALREFLNDKPALAKDPLKVKELMDVYDRIKSASERNKEGVLLDLNKAFAAVYHEQLIDAARTGRVERAKEMQLFSEPAIDRGATGYNDEKARMPNLSAEDKAQLAKWGMTPEQWFASQSVKKVE